MPSRTTIGACSGGTLLDATPGQGVLARSEVSETRCYRGALRHRWLPTPSTWVRQPRRRGLAPRTRSKRSRRPDDRGSTLELDLAVTRDGVLVVSHDRRLNPDLTRSPDGKFLDAAGPAIHSLTLAELERYDVSRLKPTTYAASFSEQQGMDGVRIPTLAAVLELVRRVEGRPRPIQRGDQDHADRVRHARPETFAAAVASLVNRTGLAARSIVRLADAGGHAPHRTRHRARGLTIDGGNGDTLQRGCPGASPWTAGLDIDDFDGSTPRLVSAARLRGLAFACRNVTHKPGGGSRSGSGDPWTVNQPSDMGNLIASGVDG